MPLEYRAFREEDLPALCTIWNDVVEAGNAFPQTMPLDVDAAREFFGEQALTQVADLDGTIFGMYILHPNNVGRCAHVANASYAVAAASRGCGLGRALVQDSLAQAARLGFRGLQFNAVVDSNKAALHLYEDLGFTHVGIIPGGFINGMGQFEDMHIFYKHCFADLENCASCGSSGHAEAEPSETSHEDARHKDNVRLTDKGGKKAKKAKKAQAKKEQQTKKEAGRKHSKAQKKKDKAAKKAAKKPTKKAAKKTQ